MRASTELDPAHVGRDRRADRPFAGVYLIAFDTRFSTERRIEVGATALDAIRRLRTVGIDRLGGLGTDR